MKPLRAALLAILATAAIALAQDPPPAPAPAAGGPKVVVDDRTDALLKGALKYLASRQSPGGAWSGNGNEHQAAITAYAVNAFLANGQLPNEGEHGAVVRRGVDFLLDCVRPDGYIAAPTGAHNMYGHGIATIVLGETYGMTQDQRLRPALERAVRLIVSTQNGQGGWRYQPRVSDADISVTVLQAVALRVAKNSGIDVPQRTLDAATRYVKDCFVANTGGFAYQARGGDAGFARTAAAIYSLQVLGHYDDPMVARGSQYLFDRWRENKTEWFTYGNFYAAPAHYMIGGDTWDRWYTQVRDKLVPLARTENGMTFWRPLDGGNGVNEVYATSVYATILAMPYQYLPIYQR